MEPIISPWVIYAVHVLNSVHDLCCGIFIFSFIGTILSVIVGLMEDEEKGLKIVKILAVITVVNTIIVIIIPSKDILLTMIATSYITTDNIQSVQGNVVEFIRQISEAVQNGK